MEPFVKYTDGGELNKPLSLIKLKYLVVGTGRCGTVYLSKLLSSVGIPCTHEGIFRHDGIEGASKRLSGEELLTISNIAKYASAEEEAQGKAWFKDDNDRFKIVADSSYLAAPFLQHECLVDTTIIHIVRRPMKVINSFVSGFNYFHDWCLEQSNYKEYHEFIYKYIPQLRERMGPVTRAALYYIEWNEMIERLSAGRRYLRYRVDESPSNLLRQIGINPSDPNTYQNTESNHKLYLEDIYTDFDDVGNKKIRERLQALDSRYWSLSRKSHKLF